MSAALFAHGRPWTEEDYLALGETPDRVELLDGSLVVTPAPTFRHQAAARRLANLLESAAAVAGLHVFEAVNIRLSPGRIAIPDLVLIHPIDLDELVADAGRVQLICEITSPSNAAMDRILKMRHYAEAGIPWYLLVDPDPPTLRLNRLDRDEYVEHAISTGGAVLHLDEPVRVQIDPKELV